MEPIDIFNVGRIERVLKEARRFIEKAEEAKYAFIDGKEDSFRSPPFAAAKRSSLDLYRALARFRKENFYSRKK